MTRKRKKELETQGEASPEENRLRRRLEAAKEALERIRKGEAPTADELATAPLLQFWCIVVEGRFPVLQGVVTGHPLLPDGHLIGTSPLLWVGPGETAARNHNRWEIGREHVCTPVTNSQLVC